MASNYKKYDLPAAQPCSSLNGGLFSSETAVPSHRIDCLMFAPVTPFPVSRA